MLVSEYKARLEDSSNGQEDAYKVTSGLKMVEREGREGGGGDKLMLHHLLTLNSRAL